MSEVLRLEIPMVAGGCAIRRMPAGSLLPAFPAVRFDRTRHQNNRGSGVKATIRNSCLPTQWEAHNTGQETVSSQNKGSRSTAYPARLCCALNGFLSCEVRDSVVAGCHFTLELQHCAGPTSLPAGK